MFSTFLNKNNKKISSHLAILHFFTSHLLPKNLGKPQKYKNRFIAKMVKAPLAEGVKWSRQQKNSPFWTVFRVFGRSDGIYCSAFATQDSVRSVASIPAGQWVSTAHFCSRKSDLLASRLPIQIPSFLLQNKIGGHSPTDFIWSE